MSARDVQREPCELGRGAHDVATPHLEPLPDAEFGPVRLLVPLVQCLQVPAVDEGRCALSASTDCCHVGGVRESGVRVPQRQHGAAPEVQDRTVLLVGRGYPQRRQAGGWPTSLGGVPAKSYDVGLRVQCVAERRRPPERQAAVEQVGDDLERPAIDVTGSVDVAGVSCG